MLIRRRSKIRHGGCLAALALLFLSVPALAGDDAPPRFETRAKPAFAWTHRAGQRSVDGWHEEAEGKASLYSDAATSLALSLRLREQAHLSRGHMERLAPGEELDRILRRTARAEATLKALAGRVTYHGGAGFTERGSEGALEREAGLVGLRLPGGEPYSEDGAVGASWHEARLSLVQHDAFSLAAELRHVAVDAGVDRTFLGVPLPIVTGSRSEAKTILTHDGVRLESLVQIDAVPGLDKRAHRFRAGRKGYALSYARAREERTAPGPLRGTRVERSILEAALPVRSLLAPESGPAPSLLPASLTLSHTDETAETASVPIESDVVRAALSWPYRSGKTNLALQHRTARQALHAFDRSIEATSLDLTQALRGERWRLACTLTLLHESEKRGDSPTTGHGLVTGELTFGYDPGEALDLDLFLRLRDDERAYWATGYRHVNGWAEIGLDVDITDLAFAKWAGTRRLKLYGRGYSRRAGAADAAEAETELLIGGRLEMPL